MSSPGLERVSGLGALFTAARGAAAGKRRQAEVAAFLMDAERRCLALGRALRLPPEHAEAWRPSPSEPHLIRDPKPRVIHVLPFADRVVHRALCAEIGPSLERYSIFDSFACRPGKGQHAAILRARGFARRWPWCLKADVSGYFASIPHDRLLAVAARRIRDPGLRALLGRIVRAGGGASCPDRGLPIGALTSQHLANLYLGVLDHHVKDDLGWRGYLRYMDDFLLFGERDALLEIRSDLGAFLHDNLALTLNEHVSRVLPVRDGVPFLGWRLFPDHVVPRQANRRRWRRGILATWRAYLRGEIEEPAAAASLAASFAHLSSFDTFRMRAGILLDLRRIEGPGPKRLQPRDPRRFLEQRPEEPARGEPEQERPEGRQRQPRVPPGEHGHRVWALPTPARPEGARQGISLMPALRPMADQARVLCPLGLEAGGTESPPPGGGSLLRQGVAAGPPPPRCRIPVG
jgi:hypothetical protein